MNITEELLGEKLYWGRMDNNLFGDNEDVCFNIKTKELFYHSCVDGSLELYRKVRDWEDLQEALWFGFPEMRKQLLDV